MKQITQGKGAPSATAPQLTDTPKGAELMKKIANPFEERKLKVSSIQRKLMDVQKLKDLQSELSEYEMGVDENAGQQLEIRDNKRHSFDTHNPKLIGDVINFI